MFITFDVALGRGQLATPLASLGPGDDGRGQAMEPPGGYYLF